MKQILTAVLVLCFPMISKAYDDDGLTFVASLKGVKEVPSVFTHGRGFFIASLSSDGNTVNYKLTYSGLNADIIQSHIHFAVPNVNGGIMVFLCGPAVPEFPNRPVCPAGTSGTVESSFTSSDILSIPTQGLGAGEFRKFLRAISKEIAYVNVHTTQSPGGEIRGQVKVVDHRHRK
jgi:hypothetical protein